MDNFYKRDTCRLCKGSDVELVLPLAQSALCDAYIRSESLLMTQETYPLELYLCRTCGYVFLSYVVNPETIYRDYIYVTTSSIGLSDHFRKYAELVYDKIPPPTNALVVDIGSNDGTLLGFFKEKGLRVLGIEPATEIAIDATMHGIQTINQFFDIKLSKQIVAEHGQASIVTINNLFANIDNLDEITFGVCTLLAPDGVLVIESSYLLDMISNMVFDFVYHEHLSYFSVKPLTKYFTMIGLELFDIEWVKTKGGSLRYYVQYSGGPKPVNSIVADYIQNEDEIGLGTRAIFDDFSARINECKERLVYKLQVLRNNGRTVAGYGASATSTTLIHHFGIADMLEYLVDDNIAKQNTYSPGFHIPVFPSDLLYERKPDYVLILAWRYAELIIKKHKAFVEQGGKFITPCLPVLKIG